MGRGSVSGIGQGLHGDLTTTGAVCISSLPNATQGGRGVLRLGDKTTPCLQCGKIGYSTTNLIPAAQILALMHLITSLKSLFVIKHFGGHKEYPGQASEGKICPGNIGMELVRNLRAQTQLLPPPASQE